MALTRYGELRNQLMRQSFPSVFAPVVIRDADSNYVPIPISERLVQCIWYDQRLKHDSLRTTDGRRARVIFQGWWNLEAGPDFRHSTIQFDDEPEHTGNVEVHLRAEDWLHHGHERDPQFNDVILHVVLWEAGSHRHLPRTRAGQILPQIALQHQLDAPLDQLHDEIDLDAYPHSAGGHHGQCASVLGKLPKGSIAALLDAAGDERFATKMRRFSRWIHRAGPEQAFYEGWMEALGYKSNKKAFRTLAQHVPLTELKDHGGSVPAAILFGVANLLPTSSPKTRDAQVKRLWNAWWKLRPDFQERILPEQAWRFDGLRPANHPHRRLGAAVALLKKHPNFMENIIGAVESDGDPTKFFTDIRDEYWSRHFTLGANVQPRETELIGASRAREIVANVVLPFVAAYAEDTNNPKLVEAARAEFARFPAAPSNSVLRLVAGQLFDEPFAARRIARTARQQQGLLQVFQDFCLNDKSACCQCQFPELVTRWAKL